MAYSFTERKRIRKSFGKRDSVLEVPYLLQMQKDAYTAFLQADIHPQKRTVEGLQADGLAVPAGKPTAIGDQDIAQATHIFAIGCTLPEKARASRKDADWSDVPDDQGYGPMRDAIVRHVRNLLTQLEKTLK